MKKQLLFCYLTLLKLILTDEYHQGYNKNEDKIIDVELRIKQLKSK